MIPFYPGFSLPDKMRMLFYYKKSLFFRFILKSSRPSNRLLSVRFFGQPLYFRDNQFDPRSIYTVFSNDYTALDKGMFSNLSTFVDVGANLGFVSRCASHSSPGCKIHCFEALRENTEICRLNNPDATVENAAVGSRNGTVELLVDQSGFMASSMKFDYQQNSRKVRAIALDDYFKPGQPIDLLKIDVEGMELEVLAGAMKTLLSTRRIVAEIHSKELLAGFKEKMARLGFIEAGMTRVDRGTFIIHMKKG